MNKPRITLHETRSRADTTGAVAEASGISPEAVLAQVADLNERLRTLLGYESDPIAVTTTGAWRVDGVAGLLRLNPQVELEVVPKFLNPETDDWRADFFLLAVLVRTGHLLVGDELAAGVRDRGDLATLIARSLLQLCLANQRRPIRRYRRTVHADFSLEGDVEWDSLLMPEPDGFMLERLVLSGQNDLNSVLKAAVDTLAPEVGEGDTRSQLHRLSRRLGPQPVPPRKPGPLPQRHRPWSRAYALAQLILEGKGLALDSGRFTGPGFVISTWSAWQALCEEVVRRALPGMTVSPQHAMQLGARANGDAVMVRPDLVAFGASTPSLLLDAKYKTRQGRAPSISSADVYESLAFLRAAQATNMLLLYPALHSTDELPRGHWRDFDAVTVGTETITGFEIQVRGLAAKSGFTDIVAGARDELGSWVATSANAAAS